jgi:hypothetical protein
VVQTDIIDAFGQSTYGQLAKTLRVALKPMFWSLQLKREERHILVGWLTHMMVINPEGGRYPRLPLGTPTSTAAFNVLWAPIDAEITKLCHRLSAGAPIRYTRYVDDLVFSSSPTVSDELIPRLKHLLEGFGYQLNSEKTRRGSSETAVIHGLCMREGRIDLPSEAILKLSKRLHRLNALVTSSPTDQEWGLAAQLIQELDFLVNTVYRDAPCPQGLLVSPELRSLVASRQLQPARWADELWG